MITRLVREDLPDRYNYPMPGGGLESGLLFIAYEVTAEAFFKPEKTTGKVDVTFTFNSIGLAGRKLVVFEKLFLVKGDVENEISAHEDLEDEGQTVKIVKTEMPKARIAEARTPKTGDESHMGFWYAFAGLSVIGIAAFAVLKVRAGKKKEEE